MDSEVKEIIYNNELILANRLTKDATKYITQDFIEYCSSGQIATYQEIIKYYKNCTLKEHKIINFNIEMLSNVIAQAKYISESSFASVISLTISIAIPKKVIGWKLIL